MKRLILIILVLTLLCGCTPMPATTLPLTTPPPATTAPCPHADADDNGSCDHCMVSLLVALDFYSVNDLHGKMVDGDNHVGIDELTTFLKKKQKTENTIFLSAGDMWQGSPESNLTQGLILTDWMNELDFAAMALGNHEYDWGEDAILENVAMAEFPILAINIFDRQTNTRVDYCEASTMVDIAGVQIGIIGAMGDCYSSIAPDKVADVYFQTDSQLTALVKAESQALRSQGADLIVYVIHDGGSVSSITGSHYDAELSDRKSVV